MFLPVMAETIDGAPNIAAIPAAIPIIKPQDTLPVKKPIPREIIAKAAKALPAFPVTILSTLHIVSTKTFELALAETMLPDCAKASAEIIVKAGTIDSARIENKAIFAKKAEIFFIIIYGLVAVFARSCKAKEASDFKFY